MTENAIAVTEVHKDFLLPHQRQTSVKNLLLGRRNTAEPQHVLNGVSFAIPRGQFFGITGRNGSGKSTLLKILAGIYQPTSGVVERHGSIVPLIELGVGFNMELSGRENVYLNGAMHGFSRRQMAAMYEDIVEFAGLDRFMEQKLKNYSSGMQVRLAFSIATRARADILLIDEVLAVGDADFQRKCLAYFSDLKHSDTTVIFVSHDMQAIREYCDRAILIEQGEITVAGTSEEVAQAYIRMFVNGDTPAAPPVGGRWGVGGGTFESVQVAAEFTQDDAEVVIEAVVAPAGDRGHLRARPGFFVRDAGGRQVFGSEGVDATEAKAHELVLDGPHALRWRVPNVLGSGDYAVSVTLRDVDTHDVLEQWDDAAHFSVHRHPRTPYLITPPVTLEHD